ncbi:MAG: hypothetical protein ACI837_002565 [Crocinitomicaceae bacterium]|jgi:hypothetical protein
MEDRIKLPFGFNVAPLQADVAKIDRMEIEWTEHFVRSNYEGTWSAIPLMAAKGATHPIKMLYSDPTIDEYVPTPFLEACDYLKEVIESFKCDLRNCRLMKLTTGSVIKEHRDHDLGFEKGTIRVHIPVQTNPGVSFYLNSTQVVLNEGTCWYLKLADLHSVTNTGADRIHLILDMKVNEWLEEQLRTKSN